MKLKKQMLRAGSTHFSNDTPEPKAEDAGSALNHQEPNLLVDPDDDTGGSTHFVEAKSTVTEKPKVQAKAPAVAAKKPLKAKVGKPVKASEEDPDEFDGEDADGPEAVEADITGKKPGNKQDVGHLDNDVDPAAGYLTNASDLEEDEEGDELEDDDEVGDMDEVEADFDAPAKLSHGDNPQSVLEAGDEWDDGEGDGEGEGGSEGSGDGGGEFETDDAAFTNLTGDDVDADEDEAEGAAPEVAADGDDMPIADVDGLDDDGDDVVFANTGTRIIALKGTRAIAYIGKKLAVKAGFGDIYLSDQFQDTVAVEMSKAGARKGLTSMGFALARVNVAKSEVINKRVNAKVKTVTAALRRSTQASTEKLEQCMAIAAVGINRKYFTNTENELRAALESELQAMGVRGGAKMLQRVFAKYAVPYAKAIVTTARKLEAMPQTARDALATSLDMTDESEMEDSDGLFGDNASPDFQAEFASEDGEHEDADFADEFDDEASHDTVTAALLRPARNIQKAQVSASTKGRFSVTAAAVLNGEAPLPFAM